MEELNKKLAKMAMEKLGITERTALLRIEALYASGILGKFGLPTSLEFKIAIDAAMMIPQLGEKED